MKTGKIFLEKIYSFTFNRSSYIGLLCIEVILMVDLYKVHIYENMKNKTQK